MGLGIAALGVALASLAPLAISDKALSAGLDRASDALALLERRSPGERSGGELVALKPTREHGRARSRARAPDEAVERALGKIFPSERVLPAADEPLAAPAELLAAAADPAPAFALGDSKPPARRGGGASFAPAPVMYGGGGGAGSPGGSAGGGPGGTGAGPGGGSGDGSDDAGNPGATVPVDDGEPPVPTVDVPVVPGIDDPIVPVVDLPPIPDIDDPLIPDDGNPPPRDNPPTLDGPPTPDNPPKTDDPAPPGDPKDEPPVDLPPGDPRDEPPLVVPPAVPEPGTWATMILGMGLCAWSLRRRRRLRSPCVAA